LKCAIEVRSVRRRHLSKVPKVPKVPRDARTGSEPTAPERLWEPGP